MFETYADLKSNCWLLWKCSSVSCDEILQWDRRCSYCMPFYQNWNEWSLNKHNRNI